MENFTTYIFRTTDIKAVDLSEKCNPTYLHTNLRFLDSMGRFSQTVPGPINLASPPLFGIMVGLQRTPATLEQYFSRPHLPAKRVDG